MRIRSIVPHARRRAAAPLALGMLAGLLLWLAPLARGAGDHDHDHGSVRHEPALPRLEGGALDGGTTGTDLFRRRRGIVYVFASTDSDADRVAALLDGVLAEATEANVAVLGVNRDPNPELAKHFMRRHGFAFPVLWDRDTNASRKLRVPPASSSLLIADAEGYLIGGAVGLGELPADQDAAFALELRKALALPAREEAATPVFGVRPDAPGFTLLGKDGTTRLTLAELRGRVVLLAFIRPTCPHCHDLLRYVEGFQKKLANPDLAIVPVSVSDQKYVIEDLITKLGLSFPIYTDPGAKAQRDYAFRGGVPEVFVIDREGKVATRSSGSSDRIHALLTLSMRHALGGPSPILLDKAGYSGEEFCGVCHVQPHGTWELTRHAYAFETLVEHGSDRDPECLRCHTVGFGKPGGFDPQKRQEHLRGVQCENCHGRGGPHQSPDFSKAGFEPVCLECHNPEHSLRFVFAERLPLVSHAANAQFGGLSVAERHALLAKRDKRERQLFEKGDYVGSAACQSCHTKEHELWANSSHARAFVTLEQKGSAKNADCQRCHTLGFGEPTGFPHAAEARREVGCESCHGPGAKHVASAGKAPESILRLTDKCDSCVILQICGSCHDDANDPGFEFELEDKLARIKHGFRDKQASAP